MKQIVKPIITLYTIFLFSCTEEQNSSQIETGIKTEVQASTIAKNITVQEFKQLTEEGNGVIIDVRTPGEFTRGNIKGAKNINITIDFSEEIQKLDKNKPIYLYCAMGGRSSRAMQIMKHMEFKEVYNLIGGYSAWVIQKGK